MNLNNGGRGSSSSTSGCHRTQLNTTDAIVPPLGILPLNSLHHHTIGILPHLSHSIREVGTTAHIASSPSAPTSVTSGSTSTSCSNGCSYVSSQSQITTSDPIVSTTSSVVVRTSSVADGSAVDYASLFECPVCMDYALPPILQCQSGHIVCAVCRSKLSSCPTCRGNLDNIRNLAMEKLASSVQFPCKYSISGCTETFHYSAKPDHEVLCEFRPYDCPCPGTSCKWLGELGDVMTHLLHNHKSITTLQGEDIVFLATDINLPGAVDWVMMQSCFGHNFMLVLEKQERVPDQLFFALVQLIGTRKQAERFVYRLELTGRKRRLTWEACPRSIHDGVQSAISSSDCLVFYSNTAQLFADNGNLGINVTISQVPTSVAG